MSSIIESWDQWLGDLALKGVDPRRWDLNQMVAAYEAALQQSAKDDAEWQGIRARLYAEPKRVKEERLRARDEGRPAPARVGLTLDSVQALLSGMAAADASYGT